jgi:hypothetical protein
MTAVEIFFEDLVHLGYIEYPDESLVQDRLKLALELEKQQIIDFGVWYSGMEQEKVKKAFERFKKETE